MALITLVGACDTSDPTADSEVVDRVAAAAIRADAARNRAVVAQRRAAARRQARIAAQQRRRTTPTTIVTQAGRSFSDDVVAIQKTVNALNAAFAASVASGISNSTVANNWVGNGVYSDDQCSSFEWALGQGVVSEQIVMYPNTLSAAPGWVDPVIGKVPQGRIYRMGINQVQTLVTTGQQRVRALWIHVTVQSDGNARLFLRCH